MDFKEAQRARTAKLSESDLTWEDGDTLGQSVRGMLTSNRNIEAFVLAGNATITLQSKLTGFRWTYRIKRPNDFNDGRPIWFVSVLKGSDNERDFGYIGQIKLIGGIYVYQRGQKCWPDFFNASDGFLWFWKQTCFRVTDDPHPNVTVWHEGRCGRCGRKLTVPASIESGFGPECVELV